MGYWNQTEEGHSLIQEDTGLIWGDSPADIMDKAIDKIIKLFQKDWNRNPTEQEIKAGLLFSLHVALADAEVGCGCGNSTCGCGRK